MTRELRGQQAHALRSILPDHLIVEPRIIAIIDAYESGDGIERAIASARGSRRAFNDLKAFTAALRSGVSIDGSEMLDAHTHERMLASIGPILALIP